MRLAAKTISIIFHPLLLTTYLVSLVGYYFPSFFMIAAERMRIIIAFIFCFTFILPVVNMIMFRMFGTISTYTLVSRQERLLPFVAITLIYLVMTGMFFFKLPISENLNFLLLIIALMVTVATVLTFFYKVSVHALALWGCVGILLPLNKAMEQTSLLWPTVLAIVVAGAVMSSRLYLNAHTPRQILFGALAGFNIGFFGMIFFF